MKHFQFCTTVSGNNNFGLSDMQPITTRVSHEFVKLDLLQIMVIKKQ